jgi:hypothetical protein
MHKEPRVPKTEENKLTSIRAQDIPDEIKRQRRLLQDFYTAWKKEKLGPSEETEDAGTSFLKIPTPTEIGLEKCEKLHSTADNLTSVFCQLSNAFLLFSNAYPKHAPTCYKLAEFCFKMATFSSRIISALWKLLHGFTLSSMGTAIKKIEFPLSNMLLTFHVLLLCFLNLYSEYVKYVTNKKSFERDEEFQIGYEQPPMESQISTFTSVVEVDSKKLGDIIVQIRNLVERQTDPPEQEEVSGHGASDVGKSDEPNTLSNVLLYISLFVEDVGGLCRHVNGFLIRES